MSLLSGLLARRRLLNAADLGDRFVPHIVPRDDFSCEERWSEWQDLNLRPPRPERGSGPAEFASAFASELLSTRHDWALRDKIGLIENC